MTKNTRYNFDYFKNKKASQLNDAIMHIADKLEKISQLQVKDRQHPYFKRNMTFREIAERYRSSQFQNDMGIISIHCGDYRIVCFCEELFSNILYVLAFDWDFSLYKH